MSEIIDPRYSKLLILFILVVMWSNSCVGYGQPKTEYLCGPLCLGFIMRQFGMLVDGDNLLREMNYSQKYGTTFLSIQNCAENYGLKCLPIEASMSWIASFIKSDMYAILSRRNHFLVISKRGEHLLLIDPSEKSIIPISWDETSGRNMALIISQSDIKLPRVNSFRRINIRLLGLYLGILAIVAWLIQSMWRYYSHDHCKK